jgi:hypothetical protein
MLNKPTLILSRLVVTKSGTRVYDEKFHQGLNVIRGENGSGKTTIADLVFFALGGDTPQWHAEAALCDFVYAEVRVNGEPLTLRREVEPEKLRPMAIFFGDFKDAAGPQTDWQLFPYAGTANKESFSQLLFHVAGIPEVKRQLATKITMHQVLRLLYVDQKTDYESIFRTDAFDQHLTREAVGNLLCGVYDDRLYEARLELSEKNAESAILERELKTIRTLLGNQAIPNLDWIEQQKQAHIREREEAYGALNTLRATPAVAAIEPLGDRRSQIASELETVNGIVGKLEATLRDARIEVVDPRSKRLNPTFRSFVMNLG